MTFDFQQQTKEPPRVSHTAFSKPLNSRVFAFDLASTACLAFFSINFSFLKDNQKNKESAMCDNSSTVIIYFKPFIW